MSAFNNLPTQIDINGAECEINTDFRTVLTFLAMWEDEEIPTQYKYALMADMFGVNSPSEVWKWLNEGESADVEHTAKIIDFQEDEKYIYSAFMQDHGIDLYEIPYLHWYKFKYLLEGLSDNTKLKQIMSIRATDTSQIKDSNEKERMRKLQNMYKLRDKEAERLLAEMEKEGW